ncbi:MAG: hypothetical protein GY729_07625 [Desulfobacteraceae bacterium]|nr:hypothetical protein [Desulfobacteraceae bacterium]
MIKWTFFMGLLFGIISIMTGCVTANSSMSNPGNVLGTAQSGADIQRIVTLTVIGKGIEPEASVTKGQAKLMAERAAVADGYRQFVEKIRGVYVDAYMKAGYGSVDMDTITLSTRSWLRGVEVIEIKQGAYGITEAHMQLRINFTRKGMIWWPGELGRDVSA